MSPPRPFDLQPGRVLANYSLVQARLGRGYEGEVYLVRERFTGGLVGRRAHYAA